MTQRISAEDIHEIKGAKSLIDHINKKTNYGICYATGSLLRPAQFKLESIGIDYDRRLLVASDNIYERENIVSQAIKQAKEFYNTNEFNRIISVGDGLWDLITADNLGLEFVGVGLQNKDVLQKHGTKVIYEDLTQFQVD